MKKLSDFLKEEGVPAGPPGGATPGNTMGMGNPMVPGPGPKVGSGDTFVVTAKLPKKKRKDSNKKLKNKQNDDE